MPELVSKSSIDMRVVKDWARLVTETAGDRRQDIDTVQPFHPYDQTFPEVLKEVRDKTHQGLEFYRRMVRTLPGYDFRQ